MFGPGPSARVRLATGPRGGPYATFGSRLATEVHRAHHGLTVRVLTTAASVENLRMLGDGRADTALTLADSAADAAAGRGTFPRRHTGHRPRPAVPQLPPPGRPRRLPDRAPRPAGRTYGLPRRRRVRHLDDRRTGAHRRRSTRRPRRTPRTRRVRRRVHRRDVDAFFWSGGAPTWPISRLARRRPLRLIPLGGLARALRSAHGPVYEEASIPAGVYEMRGPTLTVGTPSYLVCRSGLADGTARALTGVLFERRDRLPVPDAPGSRLDERYAIGTGTVPLHRARPPTTARPTADAPAPPGAAAADAGCRAAPIRGLPCLRAPRDGGPAGWGTPPGRYDRVPLAAAEWVSAVREAGWGGGRRAGGWARRERLARWPAAPRRGWRGCARRFREGAGWGKGTPSRPAAAAPPPARAARRR